MRWWMLSLSVFCGACLAENDWHFADYPAQPRTDSVLTEIDFSSHEMASTFTSWLLQLRGQPANFAGHYILFTPGCGTACQVVMMVDIDTGKVSSPHTASAGTCFSKSSNLLIINPYLQQMYGEQMPDWAYTYYYQLSDGEFVLLEKTKQAYQGECESGQ